VRESVVGEQGSGNAYKGGDSVNDFFREGVKQGSGVV